MNRQASSHRKIQQWGQFSLAVAIGLGLALLLALFMRAPAAQAAPPLPLPQADGTLIDLPWQEGELILAGAEAETDLSGKGEERVWLNAGSPQEVALRADAIRPSQDAPAALGLTILLTEDFSTAGGSTPPTGWVTDTAKGVAGVDVWRFDNPGNRSLVPPIAAPAAIFDSESVAEGDHEVDVSLDSPEFDASGHTYVGLLFDQVFEADDFSNLNYGFVYVHDGTKWQNIYSVDSDIPHPDQQLIDITAHAAGVVDTQVGFRYVGNEYADGYWIVDNVQVIGLPQKPTDLSISKTAPISVTCCMYFNYFITVTNNSDVPASSVLVTDTLPAFVNFVSASSGCNYIPVPDHRVVCDLGTIGANASKSLAVAVTSPHFGARLVNEAVVTTETPELRLMNNHTSARTTVWGGMMPAPRFVDTTGSDSSTCEDPGAPCRTVDFAGLNSFPGDTIFVAPGVYTESAWIERPVTIQGAGPDETFLDGEKLRRVLDVSAPLHLKELTVSNGRSSGKGGGLLTTHPLTLTQTRFAFNHSGDQGGGFYAAQSVAVSATQVFSNVSVDRGGGAYISGTLTMADSVIQENECTGEVAGIFLVRSCHGGGLYVYANADIRESRFVENRSKTHGGGALFNGGRDQFPPTKLYSVQFTGNRSGNNGGGVDFGGSVMGDNVLFMNNRAGVCGGGFYSNSNVHLINSRLIGNESSSFGGGSYFGSFDNTSQVHLTDVLYDGNRSHSKGGGLFLESGFDLVDLMRTHLNGNIANEQGGGIWGNPGIPVTITDSQLHGNQALKDAGGGAFLQGPSRLTNVSIISNTSSSESTFPSIRADSRGGGLYQSGSLTLTNSRLSNNVAVIGGGIFIESDDSNVQAALTNVELGNNQAEQQGAALFIYISGQAQIVHTTIAASKQMTTAAVYVNEGTVGITNTIVASHAVGLQQAGGAVFEDYSLFFDNGTNITGTVGGGSHSLTGDPSFVAPGAGDYRLGKGSAAIDAGVDLGVAHDLAQTVRPQGKKVDIGAYEAIALIEYKIHLPLLQK